ncbi:hypothetical protein HDA32_001852 [Spinactinospora alkalitolerans]|uniref:DUF3071 domain-containing protein n=1 Tax=Spinactinospora alkalitolerans TaxID=687207 RepID=A0A852TV33_9ACTN|nr:septation protein SepH [Spinactinospora alkalitolerans]NYE46732.1 hypothetical protein [Spinactinospora alkalitolerans]
MQELRLVAVSEDGTYLVLASAGRGTRFMLPVDDRLRAAVRGQFSRLGQYEIEVENPLRPKEIQARIRSGETAEAIAEAAGIPIERVRWFEGPVLQEREFMWQQAQRATVRRQGESSTGPALGDLVADRIGRHQLETGDAVWDSWKREDNAWQLKLTFLAGGEEHLAHWVYEPRRRCVTPNDEEAVRFSSPEAEGPLDLGPASANVTPFVPRRQSAREPQAPAEAPPARPAPPQVTETPPPPAPPAQPARIPVTPERARPAPAEPEAPTAAAPHPPAERPRSEPRPAADAPSAPPAPPERPAKRQTERPAAKPAEQPAPPQRPNAPAAERAPGEQRTPPLPAAAAGGGNPQPARRKGRSRRASVPSWDEIMFGSKKPE